MLPAIDFIKKHSFVLKSDEKEKVLLEHFNAEHSYHYDNNHLYRKIVNSITDKASFESLDDMPFLPVQYFKYAGAKFATSDKIHRSLFSSATSGVPSVIPIDNETSKRQVFSLASSLGDFIGKARRPFLICDLPFDNKDSVNGLAARHAAISGFTNFATTKDYILKLDGESYEPDIEKIFSLLEGAKEPVVICGFTFLVYIFLIKTLKDDGKKIQLPAGSSIIHIGGWKKLEDQKVSRKTFVDDAKEVFGIEDKDIVDIYGFTEQMGSVYPECEHGHKHVPDHAHLIVRNPYTYEKLEAGKIGVGQFMSLVPRAYSGFSVLTDDLIKIVGKDDCPCGRKGVYFDVIGRAKSAEIRGCGDIIASKIMKPKAAEAAMKEERGKLHFFKSSSVNDEINDWDEINRELMAAQNELNTLDVDEILAVLAAAAKLWREDEELREYKYQGVDFICNWIVSGEFERQLDLSLRCSRAHLDGLKLDERDNRMFMAIPRGIVAHWVAGNVPSLGIISVLLALVCKNANIVKLPRNSSNVLRKMLQILSEVEAETVSGKILHGKALSDAIYLMYAPRGSVDNEMLSKHADARIAWGGKEAIEAIVDLPKKYDCEDIIFGPKLSLAAVGKENLEVEHRVNRMARALAVDSSIFDQKACASAHNIFVENGGEFSVEEFCEILAKKMAEIGEKIEGLGNDFTVFDNIKSARLNAYLDEGSKVFSPDNMRWSVIMDSELKLNSPAYGRTVFVHAVDNLEDIAGLLSGDNQVVGLAVKSARRNEIAKKFLNQGVSRIAQVGHMADFAFPWDDIFPTDKLVRWCYA